MSKLAKTKIGKMIIKNKFLFSIYKASLGRIRRKYRLSKRSHDVKGNGILRIMEIERILEKEGAFFFVDCGTLLGFIREGKPIKWDYDIDFGIVIDSKYNWNNLEEAMIKHGYTLHHQFRFEGNITEQTYKKGITMIDFFNHFHEDNNTCFYAYYRKENYNYSSDNEMNVLKLKGVKISGTKKIKVEGGFVHVPNEAEKYLENIYGVNWRIPDPNYKDGSGPACIHLDDKCKAYLEEIDS
ncbi:hypothetical protein [Ruminococcus flavefaciens]|uniref:hypothetical protein n=1 Tax=Ruminococcus flavefaciens TaxID=1265 RepID=UPI0026EB2A0B|nr:hypothetical protein [Ruminococcus flavefaciens]